MSDAYLYYFHRASPGGQKTVSTRPATLEAIKGRGRPIMESQMVVDHTELDAEGFLAATVDIDLRATSNLMARIRSLEARAASRDVEASESADGVEKYMLSLESQELRKQARHLHSRLIELKGGARSNAPEDFIQFDASLSC